MDNSKHSDLDIEILLLGKWRFNVYSEKITIEFKDDMTYEQTRIQTSFFLRPKELITGNKFNGIWYVNQKKLYLNVRNIPSSWLNFELPLSFKISIADIVAAMSSVLIPEYYEVMRINSSKFILKDKDESILGTKISEPINKIINKII